MKKRKTVTVLGLGYVGLPVLKSLIAANRYNVYGLDNNQKLIRSLQQELGLKLNLTHEPESCLPDSNFVIVCVPTPINAQKKPDHSIVTSVFRTLAAHLHRGQHIIIESTVYPGFCVKELLPILERTHLVGGKDFQFSHCPERINPGDPTWHVGNIPRNMGSLTMAGAKEARDFYQTFLTAQISLLNSIEEAEATKIVENVFRDVNIAFANELAISFDKLGIDAPKVIAAAASKPFSFLAHYPGCGVGGDCIATDPYYYFEALEAKKFVPQLAKTARMINEAMPKYVWQKALTAIKKAKLTTKDLRIGICGLGYKPESSDTRNSPGLALLELVTAKKLSVLVHDPFVEHQKSALSLDELLKSVDVLFVCTAHQEYKRFLTPKRLAANKLKLVVDGRNFLDKEGIKRIGIRYLGIGR